MKGYVQVYTGDGKGKTTAALGLALRAVGAGKSVFIAQFVKGQKYSELDAVKRLEPLLTLKQYGRKNFIHGQPAPEDIRAAEWGMNEVGELMRSGKYELVILDEINIATYLGLIPVPEVLSLINKKPDQVELVLTGRYADQEVIDAADLVTEMRMVKHYFEKGITARKGIEK